MTFRFGPLRARRHSYRGTDARSPSSSSCCWRWPRSSSLTAFLHGGCGLDAVGPGRARELALTPGVLNPDVTQATIRTTVCRRGWTRTVRPPVSYTNALKRRGLRAVRPARAALRLPGGPPDQPRARRQPDRPAQPLAGALPARRRGRPDRERAQPPRLHGVADARPGAAARVGAEAPRRLDAQPDAQRGLESAQLVGQPSKSAASRSRSRRRACAAAAGRNASAIARPCRDATRSRARSRSSSICTARAGRPGRCRRSTRPGARRARRPRGSRSAP